MSSWPVYDEAQIADVVSVLRSGKVNAWTGPHVGEFERAYAKFLDRKHAVALANGTLALDLALHAIGIEEGDEVIVTPRSFVASASCVPLVGGIPVFADIDRNSQNLTAATIEEQITRRTKAVIVVHLAGWPCDMASIQELTRRYGIWLIEDCAQAHGAEYEGRPVGSFGDIAAFSFCQDKIITTGGEGGLVAMDDDELWKRCWSFKDHGKSYDTVFSVSHPPGFRWLHESFGTNMRMTSIQAVLGSNQLERLPTWHEQRRRNAEALRTGLNHCSALRIPYPPPHMRHAWYQFYAFVRPEALRDDWSRDRILAEIQSRNVPCFSGSCSEVYLEKAFRTRGLGPIDRLPNARELGETSMAFLVDPSLDAGTMTRHAGAIREVVEMASRAAVPVRGS